MQARRVHARMRVYIVCLFVSWSKRWVTDTCVCCMRVWVFGWHREHTLGQNYAPWSEPRTDRFFLFLVRLVLTEGDAGVCVCVCLCVGVTLGNGTLGVFSLTCVYVLASNARGYTLRI